MYRTVPTSYRSLEDTDIKLLAGSQPGLHKQFSHLIQNNQLEGKILFIRDIILEVGPMRCPFFMDTCWLNCLTFDLNFYLDLG